MGDDDAGSCEIRKHGICLRRNAQAWGSNETEIEREAGGLSPGEGTPHALLLRLSAADPGLLKAQNKAELNCRSACHLRNINEHWTGLNAEKGRNEAGSSRI